MTTTEHAAPQADDRVNFTTKLDGDLLHVSSNTPARAAALASSTCEHIQAFRDLQLCARAVAQDQLVQAETNVRQIFPNTQVLQPMPDPRRPTAPPPPQWGEQAPPAPPQAPTSSKPRCDHGEMQGPYGPYQSKFSGKMQDLFHCPLPKGSDGRCKPKYVDQ